LVGLSQSRRVALFHREGAKDAKKNKEELCALGVFAVNLCTLGKPWCLGGSFSDSSLAGRGLNF
jgi:hypothetical protein